MSVLLHTVNTVAIAIALGNYDGGTMVIMMEVLDEDRETKINSSFFRC